MSRESIIFSNKELGMIEDRKKGDRKDPHGIFSQRIRPKIIEILTWFSKRKMLRMLIEKRRRR